MTQDLTKYYEALEKADKAGDYKAAQEIANYIKSVRASAANAPPTEAELKAASAPSFRMSSAGGRRPPEKNKPEQAQNMPLYAARGAITGTLGLPADLINLPGALYGLATKQEAPYEVPFGSKFWSESLPFEPTTPHERFAEGVGVLGASPRAAITAGRNVANVSRAVPQGVINALRSPDKSVASVRVPEEIIEQAKAGPGQTPIVESAYGKPSSKPGKPLSTLQEMALRMSDNEVPITGRLTEAMAEDFARAYQGAIIGGPRGRLPGGLQVGADIAGLFGMGLPFQGTLAKSLVLPTIKSRIPLRAETEPLGGGIRYVNKKGEAYWPSVPELIDPNKLPMGGGPRPVVRPPGERNIPQSDVPEIMPENVPMGSGEAPVARAPGYNRPINDDLLPLFRYGDEPAPEMPPIRQTAPITEWGQGDYVRPQPSPAPQAPTPPKPSPAPAAPKVLSQKEIDILEQIRARKNTPPEAKQALDKVVESNTQSTPVAPSQKTLADKLRAQNDKLKGELEKLKQQPVEEPKPLSEAERVAQEREASKVSVEANKNYYDNLLDQFARGENQSSDFINLSTSIDEAAHSANINGMAKALVKMGIDSIPIIPGMTESQIIHAIYTRAQKLKSKK